MENEETVVLGYASSRNVTFRGKIATNLPVSAWAEMTSSEQGDFIMEELFNLVEVWTENVED